MRSFMQGFLVFHRYYPVGVLMRVGVMVTLNRWHFKNDAQVLDRQELMTLVYSYSEVLHITSKLYWLADIALFPTAPS